MSFPSDSMSGENKAADPLAPLVPAAPGEWIHWGKLYGASASLALAAAARQFPGLLLVLAENVREAARLEEELRFFLAGDRVPVTAFPDWETLPYDIFSPLPELISMRLSALHRLPEIRQGILVLPVGTLLQRLPPRSYLEAHTLMVDLGQRLAIDSTRRRLEQAGYQCVSQAMAHGEFAVRGSLLDIFPMGYPIPFRIDLFDEEVESIRTFDPETQRSLHRVDNIRILPAREFPLEEAGVARFRQNFRTRFEGDPQRSLIYREVSQGHAPGGLEYYLPLFFDQTSTLFDFLPQQRLLALHGAVSDQAERFFTQVTERYEQRRHDLERPLLGPSEICLMPDELVARMKRECGIQIQASEIDSRRKGFSRFANFATRSPPPLGIQARAKQPAAALQGFLDCRPGRVLFVAESTGRREVLVDTLRGFGLAPQLVGGWRAFVNCDSQLAMAVAPLEQGLWLDQAGLVVVTEAQLYGERVRQERRRKTASRDAEQIIRNLAELNPGSPVVHEDHGVGRYLGLQTLDIQGTPTEFLCLEYANSDKLYVPVSSLHLISRYTGASVETAPLHRLGGDQWEKLKRKAADKVRDVAAELLDIYSRRAANIGYAFPAPTEDFSAFAAAFAFEETPDQQEAIDNVLKDMQSPHPMDRVVCGDVGFGKTEVAMRAAFVAANSGKQVAVLVPTTLLAEQHFRNFSDRFADWPIRVESLSRFRTSKEQRSIQQGLADGSIDVIVGTHKLLQTGVAFRDLGLVIVDEEHRFGVRHKERLKSLRSEVDLLTLTATPIPRTLNMAMAGMRDLSIIATPPAERHPIKTFTSEWNDTVIAEACQREVKRGGQVYFLHNEVRSIHSIAARIAELIPGARIEVAHGQMRERELERVMRDFYHQRFNVLVCTTIIESGIDVPTANTIIINRADKLGVAQLHQLRGRVGRSHHRAYAYLIRPPEKAMTLDAAKRLEAIESLEELGAGFTLATHDLEIRGAGELLGEEQSGQLHEIGFTLYMDLLERAVRALKAGQPPALDRPVEHGAEIDLQLPALIPDSYLPDVHNRLVIYKRIASAETVDALQELQVEMIDRFGLLPDMTKNLFRITELKLRIQPLGIRKLDAGATGGRLLFGRVPAIDAARVIRLVQSRPKEFKLGGPDTLRFNLDLSDASLRIDKVSKVIELLSNE